ncbi:MAG: zeta toxin family protein, partial [Patescibacteria group bacterium]
MSEEDAKKWVKSKVNQDKVVRQFFKDHKPHKNKLAFFMAGIPGAGKTEFAQNTINSIEQKLVPIEHDKLVEYIPGYKPENYYNYRKAGSVLVSRILRECLNNSYGFIFDGTLSHEQGYKNIELSLKH